MGADRVPPPFPTPEPCELLSAGSRCLLQQKVKIRLQDWSMTPVRSNTALCILAATVHSLSDIWHSGFLQDARLGDRIKVHGFATFVLELWHVFGNGDVAWCMDWSPLHHFAPGEETEGLEAS